MELLVLLPLLVSAVQADTTLKFANVVGHFLFDLILYVAVNKFSVMSGRVFPG